MSKQRVEQPVKVGEPLGSLLVAMNDAFENQRLEFALAPGERVDRLADFVHFETLSAAGQLFVPRKDLARNDVLSALATAERELREVLGAIVRCPGGDTQELLAAADAAYYCGDYRLTENLDAGCRGDTLADYIHFVIAESSPERPAQEVIARAANTLQSCQRAISQETQVLFSRPR